MDELAGLGIVQGGAAAVLGLVVMLILLGRLVPRSILEDLRADRDARITELAAERDTWKAAHQLSEEARHVAQDQVGELLELSRTSVHVLTSLPRTEGVAHAQLDQGMATQG